MTRRITKMFNYLAFSAVFLLALMVSSIHAQSGTGSISGSVVDQAGGVVPGATVTISNPNTGFSRTVTTGSNGRYSFVAIPPAKYRVEIQASGFKKVVNSNALAAVDSTTDISVTLEPGDVSAVVDVTGGSIESIVNTQDAAVGNNFVSQQIIELPTDLRRVNDLLALQPGVTRDGYVAGGRSDQANITLDGVDINDQQTGGRSGSGDISQGSALRSTTESVEEFRITTLGANANQGRSSGAQIS
ncbi:MAG: carboxypeptidase-like regulatory domain-containing protein, partial [Pyrinomonadaceae bacterium]